MEHAFSIIAILVTLLVGAMSPGPSFVVIAQTSLSGSRRQGISMAAGLAAGSTIFGVLALAGLQAVLQQVEWLYMALKLVGGAYLLYLAYRIFSGARSPLSVSADSSFEKQRQDIFKAFIKGIVTQLSNPKTAIVFASVFAAFLSEEPQAWLYYTLIPAIFLIELLWYVFMALVLSSARPRGVYEKAKTWIDRTASFLLGAMGISLIRNSL